MYEKSQIQPYLDRLFQSPEFCNSNIYRELLTFLVDYSLKGQTPKEINIAVEFFDKEMIFDSSNDSTVRSHMHHLRKKLDSYYRNDGKQDTIQLIIPKGHYAVYFVETQSKKSFPFKKSELVLAVLLLLFLAFHAYQWFDQPSADYPVVDKDQIIWKSFFQNEYPVLLILGDHYFYMGPSATNTSSVIRDFSINSDSELNAFLYVHPDKIPVIQKTSHTYMTKRIPWAMHAILPSFVVHQREVDIKLASEVQWDDFKKYNIIYIGAFRSLGVTGKIIEDLPVEYDCQNGILKLSKSDSLTMQFNAGSCTDFQASMQEAKDYAMVIKSKGPNQRDCLFFLSTHDIGIISAIRHFTNNTQLQQFTEQYLPDPTLDSFYALFQVQGIARTDFQIDLLYSAQFNASDSVF